MNYAYYYSQLRFRAAIALFALACKHSRLHGELVASEFPKLDARQRESVKYSYTSGVISTDFPASVKDTLRGLLKRMRECEAAAYAARPRGVHTKTMTNLNRLVRDKVGRGAYY